MTTNANGHACWLLNELHCAYQASDLSVAEILQRSGLTFGRTTLLRKLKGLTPMTVAEYEALAPVLGLRVAPRAELPCLGRKRKPREQRAGSPRVSSITGGRREAAP